MTPHVLIAPDKFKGSLSASEVAAALAAGFTAAGVCSRSLPLADGGDGSTDAAIAVGFSAYEVTVAGATGLPRRARVARSSRTAVVEVANTCGLATLPLGELWPLDASTLGFGQAIRSALRHQPSRIILALGGSASTDGGTGMMTALGYEFRDRLGRAVRPGGRGLRHIAAVDTSRVVSLDGVEFVIAGDVTNPLLGPNGAAAVYGPQKGAGAATINELDEGLHNLVDVLRDAGFPEAPALADAAGAGAAGGLGFAGLLLGARMSSGAEHFLELLGFDAALAGADLVVTGEGCIDHQTTQGKLVSAVIKRSQPTPVVAVTGRTTLTQADHSTAGFAAVHVLGDYTAHDTTKDAALTYQTLTDIGRTIGAGLICDTPVG